VRAPIRCIMYYGLREREAVGWSVGDKRHMQRDSERPKVPRPLLKRRGESSRGT
jgi:hypothetical protein